MTAARQIPPGTRVKFQNTHTGEVVEGLVRVDEEGYHRVGDLNVHRDADGYFKPWVLPLEIDGE